MSTDLPAMTQAQNPPETFGVGALLKGLREVKGLTLQDVSNRIKFSVRQIEALEAEQWDALPEGLLLRGMVKNYARYLDADIEAILLQLESQVSSAAAPKPLPQSGSVAGRTELPLYVEGESRSWGWWLIILIVILVAGFYAINRGWVPDSWLVFDWLKGLKS